MFAMIRARLLMRERPTHNHGARTDLLRRAKTCALCCAQSCAQRARSRHEVQRISCRHVHAARMPSNVTHVGACVHIVCLRIAQSTTRIDARENLLGSVSHPEGSDVSTGDRRLGRGAENRASGHEGVGRGQACREQG